MKIAVIGTHGTGKSTITKKLIEDLSTEGHDVGLLSEVAGRCPMPINQEVELKAQLWIVHRQMQEEIELEHKHDHIICDRGLIDNYTYTVDKFETVPQWLEHLMEDHLQSYDYIFKTKINPDLLANDGIRQTDKDWQKQIENTMQKILKQKNIAYYQLNLDTIDYKNTIKYMKQVINLGQNKNTTNR